MAKFNEVQKKRRAIVSQRKRAAHGDPFTGKLHNKTQSISISGKRKRKLLNKWRRDQKEALEKGLVSMQDVEMVSAEEAGTSKDTNKAPVKFNVKKTLKLKKMKQKGKNKRKSTTTKLEAEASIDTMVE